jgi:sugar/nucleoside kinase (ribokinase family)
VFLRRPAAFIGKVAEDELGGLFRHDIRAVGVHFDTPALSNGAAPTARSMILVTPDGERTMNTYLGACSHLTPDDIDPEIVPPRHHLSGGLSGDPPPPRISGALPNTPTPPAAGWR